MKSLELLKAIYNDKAVLKQIHKSVSEYATNMKSMEQLKRDSKEIETYIKDTYKLTPAMFKKIVKSSMREDDNVDDIIDELQIIRDIAKVD